ncbi:MAG: hypothetical protein M3235_15190, partial [Actinomycetota bacterium]|nr:hypothetical protein [Actinomycetota bacterium]
MTTQTENTPTDAAPTMVGLLADPGLPRNLAHQLAAELPGLLAADVGGRWNAEVGDTELTLDAQAALPMVGIGRRAREQHEGWHVVVLLTDLPRRAGSQPVVADAATGERVGLVSIPALGALAQRRRTRDAVLRLVADHLVSGPDSEQSQDGSGAAAPLTRLDPQRSERADESDAGAAGTEDEVDVRLGLTGLRGRVRLLAGMVRANRPWRLVPSLAPALAAAAAGAAFGIFYSNIWSLAVALGLGRQVAVTVLAVVAMSVWLIANNQLWERLASRELREEAILSNTSTVLTVGAGVVLMYGLLFAVSLTSAAVVIPPSYLGGQLGRETGFDDYLMIAWLSCSMGTVAGAVGSGFADEDAVRKAAYSRREL